MEPLEEYHSPFDFEQGVNTSYLYLSPAYSDTPPSSPATKARGRISVLAWLAWKPSMGGGEEFVGSTNYEGEGASNNRP